MTQKSKWINQIDVHSLVGIWRIFDHILLLLYIVIYCWSNNVGASTKRTRRFLSFPLTKSNMKPTCSIYFVWTCYGLEEYQVCISIDFHSVPQQYIENLKKKTKHLTETVFDNQIEQNHKTTVCAINFPYVYLFVKRWQVGFLCRNRTLTSFFFLFLWKIREVPVLPYIKYKIVLT